MNWWADAFLCVKALWMRAGPPGQVEKMTAGKENASVVMVWLACCETGEESSVESWVCSSESTKFRNGGNNCTCSAQMMPLCSSMLLNVGQLGCEQESATCGINDCNTQVLPSSPQKNCIWRQEQDTDFHEGAMLCSEISQPYSVSRARPECRNMSSGFTVGS